MKAHPHRTRTLYYRITEGVRITVTPTYLERHSDPDEPRHVFAYRIRIENVGDTSAHLRWRHWFIHDPIGGDSEVQGDGVVGQEPVIPPGGVHEYESFCVLRAPEGHMEGYYMMERPDGSRFRAAIPRFLLRTVPE
jgi:ApaG protein